VLAGGTIHSLPIKVSRRLAVAMRTPDREGDLGVGGKRRIAAALPRGGKAEHVYEVKMEESDFASGLEVMDLLANPNVVGVFERHVPLVEAAVQRVGCVATLKRTGAAGGAERAENDEYDLDALEMRTTAEFGYLPLAPVGAAAGAEGAGAGAASHHGMMRHVTLYHAGAKDKGVYALHMPAGGAAVLVVVAPGVGAGRRGADAELTTAMLDRFTRAAATEAAEDGAESVPADAGAGGVAWSVEYVKSDEVGLCTLESS
jgi:DNA polymerase epsilon subunit 1